MALDLTPAEAAAAAAHLAGRVYFDTALEGGEGGQLSIVAADPGEVWRGRTGDDWLALRAAVARRAGGPHCDDGLPAGFAAGFVEYDGTFGFGIYEDALIYRHAEQRWFEIGDFSARLRPVAAALPAGGPRFIPQMTREEFCRRVARAQEYIAAGDIYQVNLAHRFAAEWDGDPFAFYEALRHYSPAPYAAFLELDGRAILSTSPESFLKISGRAIRTRPIKGTRPRRAEANADALSAYDLRNSAKETAELVMITDLERNDLGAICDYGSVHVKELLKLESYEHVFHLVSTVEGRLREEVDPVAALRACFPRRLDHRRAEETRPRDHRRTRARAARRLHGRAGVVRLQWREPVQYRHPHGRRGKRARALPRRRGHRRGFHPEKEWQETLDKAAGILLAAERCGES
ncbi:MAG: chorismate-binding protein [Chthoniobacter sp.]